MSQPFHHTVTRNGETTKVKTWSIRYPNAVGKRVQENGFKTRDEAAIRLRDAKREVNEEKAGIRTPRIKQNEKPLAEHLDDFRMSLEDREISSDQVKLVLGRLRRAFDSLGALLLSDLNANNFQAYLASLRKKGRAQQTCKHLVRHVKQFAKFLLEDERIETDPFRKLRPPKVSELRHRRRTLTPDECTMFLKAVRECSPSYGLSGPDQEVLFLVALNTGFRASELSRLVVADLHLDCEYPHISLSASKTKNRDEARIPLRDPELVQILKNWIVGKLRNEKLWAGNWASSSGGSRMVQKALKVAEIPFEVDGRKVDFHALRYTFITNLIKAGETPAYVQRLARHSDINLTLRVYTDLGLGDLYHGRLRDNHESPLQSTGTPNDAPPEQSDKPPDEYLTDKGGSKIVAQNVAHFSVSEGLSASLDVTEGDNEEGANQPQDDNCDTPQRQRATGDNTSCRSVSQENNKRRGGDSNACPRCHNDRASQQLTKNGKSLGVSGEWVECNDCPLMTEIDPTLNNIINVWSTLPEQIKKAVETICLNPIS